MRQFSNPYRFVAAVIEVAGAAVSGLIPGSQPVAAGGWAVISIDSELDHGARRRRRCPDHARPVPDPM